MNGTQYEEFCRLFVVNELNIPIENIKSGKIPSAIRPGLEEYKNEIDLYWELEDKLTRNMVIVNAKWRSSDKDKVDQPDVLLIQQVKKEIAAHKAMMITSTDFTDGARKAAKNHEIALHIVRPNFEYATLHSKDRPTMQTQLQEYINDTKDPYIHEIVNKAFDFDIDSTAQTSVPDKTDIHTTDIKQTPMNRMVETTSHRRTSPSIQKVQTRDGGSRSGRQSTPKSGQQGGPPSGRQGSSQSGQKGAPPSGRQGGSSGPPKGSGSTRGGGGSSNRGR